MDPWLKPALDYIQSWLAFQMRVTQQPGCLVAIAHRGAIVAEYAFGHANLATDEKLTPRHRFRIASHSKSFTSAGLMKLREQRKLRLDDPVGNYVKDLHPQVAATTLAQLLSHSAGVTRDGADAGQFIDSRPYLNTNELMAELQQPLAIDPGLRLKYSNHGFALLGLVIEAITGEPYRDWILREIVEPVGLRETQPDMPLTKNTPFAQGPYAATAAGATPCRSRQHARARDGVSRRLRQHCGRHRARFFAQLAPNAKRSVLSAASRREMTRPQWRNPHAAIESYYGLGIMSGKTAGWDWFGHTGGFHGYISRTAVIPVCDLTISIFTNASDGWGPLWLDGAMQILRAFATRGAPQKQVRDWTGRLWTSWNAFDLVPMGDRVLVAVPQAINPFMDVAEIAVTGKDKGMIAAAAGYSSYGEPVRRVRSKAGKVTEVWLAGSKLRPEAAVAAELERKYGTGKRRPAR